MSTMTFALGKVSDPQLRALCQTLWGLAPCTHCSHGQVCIREECPQQRTSRLEPFFQYYREVVASYIPEFSVPNTSQAIRSHEDLIGIIHLLQQNPTCQRRDLTAQYFWSREEESEPPLSDQHRAFNLAIRVMLMVSCCIDGQAGGLLESGVEPSVWRGDQSLVEFLQATFPTRNHPALNDQDEAGLDIKSELKAERLRKVAGLQFKGTNDLRNHLKLDLKTGVLEIYHHTSVLKEHLKASNGQLHSHEMNTFPIRGNLPRQLVLETLDSVQNVLFPYEEKSQALLRSLVSRELFDPDCLRFWSTSNRADHEQDIKYHYWGSRLMDLYDEIENPKPRGFFEKWLEQRSKARHVMFATLCGVMMAVLLGILGLFVGIFQAWVSYQAWKHPVNTEDGETK